MGNRQSLKKERGQGAISKFLRPGLRSECIPEEQKLNETRMTVIETKAIRLTPVIRCIFKYLDLADLKNCRYVCPEWNAVAQPILRSRSLIRFRESFTGKTFQIPQFLETFSENHERMPFTAFAVNYSADCAFKLDELNTFFQQQKKTLRELRIVSFETKVISQQFDVTPWIMKSLITEETKHRTRFLIFGALFTRIIVQNLALVNVHELFLWNCQVNLEDEIKCRPVVLKLHCVAFFKNGIKLSKICISDNFDFSRLKHLDLWHHEDDGSDITKLSLNMKGGLKLESLVLQQITVDNWRICLWEVNDLYLSGVFVEETEMPNQQANSLANKIDIYFLPQSIKKLTMAKSTIEEYFCSRPVISPNLQSLKLYLKSFSILSEFLECPNLVTLDLETFGYGQVEINSDWIPNTVKRLKLGRVSINWTEEKRNLNLDKLVLVDSTVTEVKKICCGLNQIKELVVLFFEWDSANENIFDFFLVRNPCELWKTIVVGPFNWEKISFKTSSLSHLVDKKAEFYKIENQIIKSFDDPFALSKNKNIQV